MNWDELRAVASEGMEIGCHTETHPILSRLSNRLELVSEIRGAKERMEDRLGFNVRHFCYPNGRTMDVGEAAIRCVREAGFVSAVSCTFGLNTIEADRFQIHLYPLRLQLRSSLLRGIARRSAHVTWARLFRILGCALQMEPLEYQDGLIGLLTS